MVVRIRSGHRHTPKADAAAPGGIALTSLRVLLVEDHALVRSGLRLLLEAQPGWRVVGESGSSADACALARDLVPDVALLDLHLGDENAVEAIPALLEACATTRILVLTADHERETHDRAISLGAAGLVVKDRAAAVLLDAVQAVSTGAMWLDETLDSRVLDRLRPPQPERSVDERAKVLRSLTPREREVIAVVCEGLRNREVATRLFISEATVRHHLTSVFAKLGLAGRFELIVYANRHGLTKP